MLKLYTHRRALSALQSCFMLSQKQIHNNRLVSKHKTLPTLIRRLIQSVPPKLTPVHSDARRVILHIRVIPLDRVRFAFFLHSFKLLRACQSWRNSLDEEAMVVVFRLFYLLSEPLLLDLQSLPQSGRAHYCYFNRHWLPVRG